MKKEYILCVLFLLTLSSCTNYEIYRNRHLPDNGEVKQMADNSWVIISKERFGTYYFVGNNHIDDGVWVYCDCGTLHYSDSLSAKEAFLKIWDSHHFKNTGN